GSGKTAAYALPLLQQLLRADPAPAPRSGRRRTRILVLVPTRELAQQVGEFMRNLARVLDSAPRIAVVFGGVSINPQMMGLRGGAEVVVATPGRLLDLVDQNALQINALDHLVLDEADRLLGLGFADELGRILALLPRRQQTLLFSATFTPEVQQCADALLHEPERILMDAAATEAPDIVQRAIAVDESRRTQLLRHLVETEQWPQVLVFVATKYATELVAHKLVRAGIHAASLHGDLAQGTRTDVLQAFKDKEARVLIATDVAARGIDIARLPVVVNYDLPRATADYLHRIGRTGRAGESGLALSFVTAAQEAHFRLIEKRQQQRVPREVVTGFEPTEQARAEQLAGGVKGKRKSKKDKLREAAALAKDDASASKR
ncbi:MAG: DEAD/DEAH box helicase, partial [Paucibacter sp.]|nr:DEAD/DEAH box helicase [Roseateles sp.]